MAVNKELHSLQNEPAVVATRIIQSSKSELIPGLGDLCLHQREVAAVG